jgi:hypothetical protein
VPEVVQVQPRYAGLARCRRPTGIPLHYEFDDGTFMPSAPASYVDPGAAMAAIEVVANQARGKDQGKK